MNTFIALDNLQTLSYVCASVEIDAHGPACAHMCVIVFVLIQTVRANMERINQSLLEPELNPCALTPNFMYRISEDITMRDFQLSASWSKHFFIPIFTGMYSQLLSTLLRAIHKPDPDLLSFSPDVCPFLRTHMDFYVPESLPMFFLVWGISISIKRLLLH